MAIIRITEMDVWHGAGWVFSNILEAALPCLEEPRWRDAVVISLENNMRHLDLSEISDAEFARFRGGVSALLAKYRDEGPSAMADPTFYAGFMARMEDLLSLLDRR